MRLRYILVLTLLAAPVAAQQPLSPGEVLLEVQSVGEARVAPDVAYLNIGVVSTAATVSEATDANARRIAAVIAALRGAGVEARYVRTDQLDVQPRFANGAGGDGVARC